MNTPRVLLTLLLCGSVIGAIVGIFIWLFSLPSNEDTVRLGVVVGAGSGWLLVFTIVPGLIRIWGKRE